MVKKLLLMAVFSAILLLGVPVNDSSTVRAKGTLKPDCVCSCGWTCGNTCLYTCSGCPGELCSTCGDQCCDAAPKCLD